MPFAAGIDLGTTFTAAATNRDGRVEMFRLGSSSFTVPSVLYFAEGGAMTTGETARRRLTTEPDRVAHEFKRRMGDPAPLMIGGAPYAAHLLTGRLLDWVVDRIEEQEGERPELVTVTHPANWGPFRRELMDQAIKAAEVSRAVTITEPEAAAIAYATAREVQPGAVIAVYDLGGGTFDAALLRRTDQNTGFELIGEPDGVEHLGGLDFDATLYGMVVEQISDEIDELDPQAPNVRAAVQRLREECVAAKIALSTDTDATIPVILPGFETQIRVNRNEFEQRIAPLLQETIGALRRTLRSAGVEAEDLDRVLLVGGSSRIPLVGQLVTRELGRPVAIDSDPKNAIARGAAIHSAQQAGDPPIAATYAPPSAAPIPSNPAPPAVPPVVPVPVPVPVPPTPAAPPPPTPPPPTPTPPTPTPPTPTPAAPPPPTPTPTPTAATAATPPPGAGPARSKTPFIIGGVVAAIAVIGGILFASSGGEDPPPVTRSSQRDDSILAVENGDCLKVDARGNIDNVRCSEPNLGEVYFVFESELGPGSKDPFPGADALFEEGQPVCDAELANANPTTVVAPFLATVISSDEVEWESLNSRRIVCLAEPATSITAFQQDRCYDRALFDDPTVSSDITLTVVECVPPFFGSVYLSTNFSSPPDAFPGAESLLVEAIPECEAQFETQTGTPLEGSGLLFEAIIPNEIEWDAGHRFFACGSYAESGIVSFSPGLCTRKEETADDPDISLIFLTQCVTVEDGSRVTVPHAGEVIAQVPLSGGPDDPFPGNQTIFDEAQPLCNDAFEPYVGTPLDASSLIVFAVAPGEDEWIDLGVRTAACTVESADGSELTQAVLQSGL